MEHSNEQLNYIKVLALVYDCILPNLRTLFQSKWKRRNPSKLWIGNLYKELRKIKGGKDDGSFRKSVLNGNPSKWDLTLVIKALSMIEKKETENKIENNCESEEKEEAKEKVEEGKKVEKEEAEEKEEEETSSKKENAEKKVKQGQRDEKEEEDKMDEMDEAEEKKNIKTLKAVRNHLFHWPNREMTNEEKDNFFEIVKGVFEKFQWSIQHLNSIKSKRNRFDKASEFRAMMEEEKRIGNVV